MKRVPGQPSWLRVQVANQGTGNAPATSLKLIYRGGGKRGVRSVNVPAVAAKRTVWVRIDAPGRLAAARQVILRVDDPNRVPEANENNNGHKFK